MACRNCSFRKKIEKYRNNESKKTVYLDYSATTPIDIRVLGAYEKACRHYWANPSSFHSSGQSSFSGLEKCRAQIGKSLDLKNPDNIFFTNSTYTASSALIKLMIKDKQIKRVITTNIEHSSINDCLNTFNGNTIEIIKLKVDNNGMINLRELETFLKEKKSIVIYSPVNHETGSSQNYIEIFKIADLYNSFVFFDAVQTISRVEPQEWIHNCHGFIISAHKIYGPKGTVLLYISPDLHIDFDNDSCEQEGGLFYGTVDLPSIMAFNEAISLHMDSIEDDLNHFVLLSNDFFNILDNSQIRYMRESPDNSIPGILNISLTDKKIDMEDLFVYLYSENICISRYSACSGKVNGPSEILSNMGRKGFRASQSLRISLGRKTQRSELFLLVKALSSFLAG